MTVYFCRSRVISKQQANYSGCIPRKKSFLNCFAHSLLALNYHKLRDWCVAGFGKSKPPSLGLVHTWFLCQDGDDGFHSIAGTLWQLLYRIGDYQPRSAIASRALLTSVIRGSSVQVGWKLVPFPSLNFDDVLPERQMMMGFLWWGRGESMGKLDVMVPI